MTQRLRIRAREGHAAAAAGAGFARDFFIRGQQGAAVRLVSRLSAPAASGGFTRGRALDGGCVAGRGLRGILRVLAKTGVEFGDLLTQVAEFGLEVTEDGKESGLGGGGDQIPKFLGNGRLLRHGLVIGSNCLPGYRFPAAHHPPRQANAAAAAAGRGGTAAGQAFHPWREGLAAQRGAATGVPPQCEPRDTPHRGPAYRRQAGSLGRVRHLPRSAACDRGDVSVPYRRGQWESTGAPLTGVTPGRGVRRGRRSPWRAALCRWPRMDSSVQPASSRASARAGSSRKHRSR